MNSFNLKILAYDAILFRGKASSCSIQSLEGSRTFEAKHENFMTILREPSTLHFKTAQGENKELELESGIVSFLNNDCIITGSRALKKQ